MSPPAGVPASPNLRGRLILFVCWLALVAWLCSTHVFWRDEVRAFSLALSGSNYVEMLRNVHGEGHPALWYLILRGAHDIFPYREVLPIAGAVIGIAAMGVLTFFSPFRTLIIALVLFSFYGAFEYVVSSRNYGISALVMFGLAAVYRHVRNDWRFGLILALLCNTNVPSCFLAAAFLLFRFVEMLTDKGRPTGRQWLIFGGNVLVASLGAYLCFRTVYPTFNDEAVSSNFHDLSAGKVLGGLIDPRIGFTNLGFSGLVPIPVDTILLAISCLAFIRKPAALAAAFSALIVLKLFFYLVYVSYYRHEILYLIFLISLHWMALNGAGGTWRERPWQKSAQFVGTAVFFGLLAIQSVRLVTPVRWQLVGLPFSRAADVGKLLQRPEFAGAIVMGDPDTMLEPLAYYSNNPIWFLRQQRFGRVVRLSTNARHQLSLADVLSDAERLHRQTGRPVLFLSHEKLQDTHPQRVTMMFYDTTVLRPAEVRQFEAMTRLVARLRPAGSDEHYDVYAYPR